MPRIVMSRRFDEAKTTQAASLLLSLAGGSMSVLKLVKLLYLVDRQAILTSGRPISFDEYYSLSYGPILQNTLDRINDAHLLPGSISSPWRDVISPRDQQHMVSLRNEGEHARNLLSEADEKLIHETYTKYGEVDRWKLVEVTHRLPEWQDPGSSRLPIHIMDILLGEGVEESEALEIEEAVNAESQFVAKFGAMNLISSGRCVLFQPSNSESASKDIYG